jgi:3-phosphoshikimate 1-carboxyvinyltransferase
MQKVFHKIKPFKGDIIIPPDKSITHRAIILGTIAKGITTLHYPLICKDTISTLNCVSQLGVKYEICDKILTINSPGLDDLSEPKKELDAGNSGTTIRLLSGLLASLLFKSTIIGDKSLSKRPMKRIIEPLTLMGAKIHSSDGCPPLVIEGTALTGIEYNLYIPSAQVKSALILAAINAKGKTIIKEKNQSRDHTERMLPEFDGKINIQKYPDKTSDIIIPGKQTLESAQIHIPGDISSAAYFIALTLLVKGSSLRIKDVGLNPTRTGFIDILDCQDLIKFENLIVKSNEPRADIIIQSGKLKPFTIKKEHIPLLIDEIPILCVLATQIHGRSTIMGATELRVKECDRIKAISNNLKMMGANIDVNSDDDIIIEGPSSLKGSQIKTYNDHRTCMAFSIAGLIANGTTTISDINCVDYSFPDFFDIIEMLGGSQSEG